MISLFKSIANPYEEQRPALFEAAFYEARVGMALVDHDGVIIDCNQALANFLGTTREYLTSGKLTFLDVTHQDYRDADKVQFSKLMNGDIPGYTMEKIYISPSDQTERWGRLNVVKAGKYAVEIVVGQVEDIQELKESNAKLQQMVNERDEAITKLRSALRAVGKDQHETLIKRASNG